MGNYAANRGNVLGGVDQSAAPPMSEPIVDQMSQRRRRMPQGPQGVQDLPQMPQMSQMPGQNQMQYGPGMNNSMLQSTGFTPPQAQVSNPAPQFSIPGSPVLGGGFMSQLKNRLMQRKPIQSTGMTQVPIRTGRV